MTQQIKYMHADNQLFCHYEYGDRLSIEQFWVWHELSVNVDQTRSVLLTTTMCNTSSVWSSEPLALVFPHGNFRTNVKIPSLLFSRLNCVVNAFDLIFTILI